MFPYLPRHLVFCRASGTVTEQCQRRKLSGTFLEQSVPTLASAYPVRILRCGMAPTFLPAAVPMTTSCSPHTPMVPICPVHLGPRPKPNGYPPVLPSTPFGFRSTTMLDRKTRLFASDPDRLHQHVHSWTFQTLLKTLL